MSFSSEQKAQIISAPYKSRCCRWALLHGMLFAKARLEDGMVSLSLEGHELCEFTSSLISEFFSKEPKISSLPNGGRGRLLSFTSSASAKYLSEITATHEPITKKRKCCTASFFKGIFLAAGRVSDPRKQYSIEITASEREHLLLDLFTDNGIDLRSAIRRSETVLYSRNSTVIEDFFALSGMNATAFELMNAKIENEIRNNVNRVRNCETNNIDKAVLSAVRQISAIETLEALNLLSMLPEELQRTARLRLEKKDLSLSQLALSSSFPITKSGLSHRLNRIVKIATELTGKEF